MINRKMVNNTTFGKEYFYGHNSKYKGGYKKTKERDFVFNYIIKEFIDPFVNKSRKLNILDVGCATGIFLMIMKNKYKKANLYGIDISQYAIKECSKKLNGFFSVIDVNKDKFPFKENYFDIIVSLEVIEHLMNEDNYLRNIYGCLKREGIFIFSCPSKSGLIRKILDKDNTHINLNNSNYYLNKLNYIGFKLVKYKKIAVWGWPPTVFLRNLINKRHEPITTKFDVLTQNQIYLFKKS